MAVIIGCGALGFAGATIVQGFVRTQGDGQPHRHVNSGPDGTAAEPGTSSVEGEAPDPRRQGPPWAVIVYRSRDGRMCAAFGRKVDGKVGALNGGRFSEYPIHEGGSCIDLRAAPAGAQVSAGAGPEDRTIVHGIAGPRVKAVDVTTPSGTRPAEIGPRGGFVVALEPGTAVPDVSVVAVLEDGDTVRLL